MGASPLAVHTGTCIAVILAHFDPWFAHMHPWDFAFAALPSPLWDPVKATPGPSSDLGSGVVGWSQVPGALPSVG